MCDYEYLALSGGGVKGISYIGVFKALEKLKIRDQIKGVVGSSSGAMAAYLFTLGYKSEELWNVLSKLDFTEYTDDCLHRFMNQWGFDHGNKIINLFYAIGKQKVNMENLTFAKLYKQKPIELIIIGSCISTATATQFSYKTTPDMLVLDAIRISIAIPYKFTPIKYKGDFYVDGAVFSPYPIDCFEGKKVLGFTLTKMHRIEPIENPLQYTVALIISIEHRMIHNTLDKYYDHTVSLNTKISPIKFDLNEVEKKSLYNTGYLDTIKFLVSKQYKLKLLRVIFDLLKIKDVSEETR